MLLCTIITFSFNLFYGQDLVSSTVEPVMEFMPSYFNDINYRSQHVVQLGRISHFETILFWNMQMLGTHDFEKTGNATFLDDTKEGVKALNIMRGKHVSVCSAQTFFIIHFLL